MPLKKFFKFFAVLSLIAAPILSAQSGAPPQSTPPGQIAPPAAAPPQAPGAPSQEHRMPMIPDTFTNLKILPSDIKKPELMKVMKGFSMQLGVRCRTCHDANDDLSQANFASDAKDEKVTARIMMQMTRQLNADYLSKLPQMPAAATCWTCHRGKQQPEEFTPPASPGGPPPKAPDNASPDAHRKDASPNTQSNAPPK